MGRFDHLATRPARGPRDIFKWKVLDALAGRNRKDPGGFVTPRRDPDRALVEGTAPQLTWIGHATLPPHARRQAHPRRPHLPPPPGPGRAPGAAGDRPRRAAARRRGAGHAQPPRSPRSVEPPAARPRAAVRGAAGQRRSAALAGRAEGDRARLVAGGGPRRHRGDAGARAPLVDALPLGPQRHALGRLRDPVERGDGVPLGGHGVLRRLRRDRRAAWAASTGPCCPSARTSRAGSWSRSTWARRRRWRRRACSTRAAWWRCTGARSSSRTSPSASRRSGRARRSRRRGARGGSCGS